MVMTSVELKRKLEKLNTGILKTETELNDLQQQQIDCTKKQNKISGLIGIANRKFDDKKKMYLASVARKIRYLLIKRKYNDSSYMHHFEQLVDLEDELMGEIEKRHGI